MNEEDQEKASGKRNRDNWFEGGGGPELIKWRNSVAAIAEGLG